MDRRTFLATLAGVLLAAPLVAEAQQARRIARIGYLSGAVPAAVAPQVEAFRQGLRELGYVEGKTVVLEVRYSEGRTERIPDLARELVGLKMDVIVTGNDAATAAVKRETQAIPIVMMNSIDPVGTGFVATLAHPGGNVTGLSNVSAELSGSGWSFCAKFVLPPHPVTLLSRGQIASFAQRNRLPPIYGQKEYVVAGGLISYGPSLSDQFRRAAVYVDKILKGAKPGDLPVEQPTKFELVINLKTAKALGLTIPPSLLARADEIVE
jgi:putative tryptophan/tyrosine transport system substrate-binding protein